MTFSADLRDKLLRELDCIKSDVESQLPCLEAFNLVLSYDGADSDWYDGVKQRTAEIQKMIATDRATILAIQTLLATVDGDTPAATFTAEAAKDHTASKVDVQGKPSGKAVERRKVVTAKGTRPTLRAKLTDAQIGEIRSMVREGWDCTYNQLASKFNVSRGTIGNIVKRKGCYA